MSRALLALLALLPAIAAWPSPVAAASPDRPNVLFVTIDDLRCEIGCYGHPQVRTPRLDRLAREGLRFDRAYCQFTICNPSRVSFLTGMRPGRTGVLDNRRHFREPLSDVVTLPQLFRESGYRTARLGKIFHGAARMEDPKAWDSAGYPVATPLGRQGEGRSLTGGRVRWCRWLAAEGEDEDQPDGQIAREGIRFLETRPTDRPFFLALGFMKPHDPFHAPKRYFEPYPPESVPVFRDPPGSVPGHAREISGGWKKEFDRFTDRERKEFLRAYWAGTTFVDTQLGKVLDALDRLGLAGSTIVVVLGDHGYHLGERGWWNKNTLYELSCRAPLIVRAPGMKARGKATRRIVEFIDVYPTLVELCGLKLPPTVEGRSFRRLLDDPEAPGKEAAFSRVQRGRVVGLSVRTDRWRYTEWDEGREGAELYDHETDPGEYRNLASDSARAGIVRRLRGLLEEVRRREGS